MRPDLYELNSLRTDLASAGARLRTERSGIGPDIGPDRPDAAFATGLRARLLDAYAIRTPVAAPPSRRLGHVDTTRWAVLAVAAALVLAVVGSTSREALAPSSTAQAGAVVGATLVRAGSATTLADGATLRANDEIRVDPAGRATLELGGSIARMDGGAIVRLVDLAPSRLQLELVAGRSYHRVSLPVGGTYTVTTGVLAWTALGTAFDLERTSGPNGVDRIRLLGLQHRVGLTGPNLRTTVGQGDAATLDLTAGTASDLTVGPIDPALLEDPWLLENARSDQALGLPPGVIVARGDPPGPTDPTTPDPAGTMTTEPPIASPTASPPPGPTSGPGSTAAAKPAPTGEPRVDPTPRSDPTAKPTPTPRPSPMPVLDLRVVSCAGGVVIDWSRYRGARFGRYTTIRASAGSIPAAYPPHGGAIESDGSSTPDRWRTSAYDTSAADGATYSYRTLALDRSGRILAASAVASAAAAEVGDLGVLDVGPGEGSSTVFQWTAYGGSHGCFTWYKIAWSKDDPTPSSLDGAGVAVVSSRRGLSEAVARLEPGTYHFRLEVLRATDIGSPAQFLVAHSSVATYVVP
jgi:hypothetical protein